ADLIGEYGVIQPAEQEDRLAVEEYLLLTNLHLAHSEALGNPVNGLPILHCNNIRLIEERVIRMPQRYILQGNWYFDDAFAPTQCQTFYSLERLHSVVRLNADRHLELALLDTGTSQVDLCPHQVLVNIRNKEYIFNPGRGGCLQVYWLVNAPPRRP